MEDIIMPIATTGAIDDVTEQKLKDAILDFKNLSK